MASVTATDQSLPISMGTSQSNQKKTKKTAAPPTPVVVNLGKRKSCPPDRLQSIDFRTKKPTIKGSKKAGL
ncbi:hypothetical protein L5515_014447 [Caenorhabditis briggsae]|uniref:Uncharacterized protein n=1 Tax=Caenorhabditis briggsae TaxID=6238 RepID=A0AAE9DLJ8_CAEBR|nr:hypothetical protein L3Y34_018321 [Caenorhabditis briggsae]UMM18333.1 hypothetical protein L5515_014447 [Caenorhabditis briggsae]